MRVYCKKDWFVDYNEYMKQWCPTCKPAKIHIEFEKGKYYNAFNCKNTLKNIKNIGIWFSDNSDYLQFDFKPDSNVYFNKYFITEEQHNRNLKLQKLNESIL